MLDNINIGGGGGGGETETERERNRERGKQSIIKWYALNTNSTYVAFSKV